MKVLFSPVGGTDPISNFKDGAMLHICRYYKPDKVYLYLSGEMCTIEDETCAYTYCLDQLGSLLNHTFEYEIIRKEEMTEVQVFDIFVTEFQSELRKIEEKEKRIQEFYFNVSSGTPAMKSALLMISILSDGKYIPIQVDTPQRKMNPRIEEQLQENPAEKWELNEDNTENTENRTTIASSNNWIFEIKKEIISQNIRDYDYVAAIRVLQQAKRYDSKIYRLLKAADFRLKMDFNSMDQCLKGSGYSFVPVKNFDFKSLVEYTLGLQIRIYKKEYADFIRALSPVMKDIYELVLQDNLKEQGIDLRSDLYKPKRNGGYRWDRNKLERYPEILCAFESKYGSGSFHYNDITNDNLAVLIETFVTDEILKERISYLRKIEKNCRNKAAHEMTTITDDTILDKKENLPMKQLKNKVLHTIKWILNLYLKDEYSDLDRIWNSYERMNDILQDELKLLM